MPRLFVLGLVATLALFRTTPAGADQVHGTRSAHLVERKHEVVLTLYPGHAELVVQRSVFNGGKRHDQAMFFIDLPEGAVAVGLRTLGARAGRPHWFPGELLEAETAAERYRELTGIGGYYPKDPALLSWRSQRLMALQVFPCPPGELKTIEYTLTLPTEYRDGAHHLTLDALGTHELIASIRAKAANPRHRILVEGVTPPPVITPERGAPLDFALLEPKMPALGGELVEIEFAPQRVLTQHAVRTAPRLSEVPRGAHVVLVLDASLSTDSGFIDRARTAFDAYLSHFDDARVELLSFDRRVERRFDAFLPVAEARKRLESVPVPRRNGSHLERALFEADKLLATTRRGVARRIVLVTDGRTRSRLTPELLRAATATSGAVTHLGILEEGAPGLSRNDEHPWAWALKHNRGLVWQAQARSEPGDEELRDTYEEWARPVRLHHVQWTTPDLALQERLSAAPTELEEGQGFGDLLIVDAAAPFLAVEGELWTERVATTLRPDAKREKLLAAQVFGTPLLYDLEESEMMTLAMKGGAVSPVTSYLAIEPGVRPSTEGLDWGAGEGIGLGGIAVRGGATAVAGRAPPIDRQAFLDRALRDDWRRCRGRPGSASVRLESTLAEIVAVEPDLNEPDALLESCLREAAWNLILPAGFDEEWNAWVVDV